MNVGAGHWRGQGIAVSSASASPADQKEGAFRRRLSEGDLAAMPVSRVSVRSSWDGERVQPWVWSIPECAWPGCGLLWKLLVVLEKDMGRYCRLATRLEIKSSDCLPTGVFPSVCTTSLAV